MKRLFTLFFIMPLILQSCMAGDSPIVGTWVYGSHDVLVDTNNDAATRVVRGDAEKADPMYMEITFNADGTFSYGKGTSGECTYTLNEDVLTLIRREGVNDADTTLLAVKLSNDSLVLMEDRTHFYATVMTSILPASNGVEIKNVTDIITLRKK